jgi:peptide-methionine (S)-S-oxide reductase
MPSQLNDEAKKLNGNEVDPTLNFLLEKNKPFKEAVVTEIVQATEFYPAEDYHQHCYKKNPIRYKYYRTTCGCDKRLKELWGSEAGQ